MSAIASQNTGVSIVCSTVFIGADQRNQSSASLAFVRETTGDWGIPLTKASNVENISIWWRHNGEMRNSWICRSCCEDLFPTEDWAFISEVFVIRSWLGYGVMVLSLLTPLFLYFFLH